jgi:hypothetical protein
MHWHRLYGTKILSLHGVKVRTGKEDVPRSVLSALFKGTFEKFECDLVKPHVTSGAKVLEIGTGIGQHAIDDLGPFVVGLQKIKDDPAFGAKNVEGGSTQLDTLFSKRGIVDQYLDLFEKGPQN